MPDVGPRKIAVGDLGEFWYGNYKDPFLQLEGAVPGYPQGALLKDDAGCLLCAYCGKTFKSLPNHINKAHGLSAAEYKESVGLLQKSALVSESIRQSRIRTALRNRSHGVFKDPTQEAVTKSLEQRRVNRRGHFPPEKQNLTGRCYAQILEVARQIVREDGRVTIGRLAKRGIWQHNIEMMFGSLANLARLASDRRRFGAWTPTELTNALRSLGDKLGRTPSSSDLSRYGLPTLMAYYRAFGSYIAACEQAGLQPYQWVPKDPQSEAARLLAWATTGDVVKAGAAAGVSSTAIRNTLAKYGIPAMPPGGGLHVQRVEARNLAADIAARLDGSERIHIAEQPRDPTDVERAILVAYSVEGTQLATIRATPYSQRRIVRVLGKYGVPIPPRGAPLRHPARQRSMAVAAQRARSLMDAGARETAA